MKKSGGLIQLINRYNYENPKFHRNMQSLLNSLEEVKKILNMKKKY